MSGRAGRRAWWAGAVGAVVVGGLGAPAAAAAEPSVTRCSEQSNSILEQVVEGDLLVDDTTAVCGAFRTHVTGDVVVVAGARFDIARVTVEGDVRTAGGVRMAESRVQGDVVLDGLDTASLETWIAEGVPSTIIGDVTGQAADVRIALASVWGTYDVTVRDVTRIRDSARMVGAVTARGGRLLAHDATFLNGLTVTGTSDSIVCRSTVAGDLRVTALADYARIGVEGAAPCNVVVSGSLVVVDNPHSVDLGSVHVAGDLVCEGNTGPRGVTTDPWRTRVHGERTGACAV